MRVLSLFDGISACQVALNNIGVKDYEYYASEIDKYAISVTQNNFPNTIQLGDVKDLTFDIGSFDILCGGSPCQSFSIAGNQKGFDDDRGQLFWEYVRILKEVKPKFFIFENVNSMKQKDKDIISKAFGFEPTVFNSALVTAQQRKRLYYVGVLQKDGTYAKADIPLPKDRGILLKDILENGVADSLKSNCLTATYHKCSGMRDYVRGGRQVVFDPICVASRGRNIVDGKRCDEKGAKTEQRLEPNLNGKTNTLTTVQKDNMVLEPLRIWQYNKGGQGDRVYSTDGKSICLSVNGGDRGAKTGLYFTPIEVEEIVKTQKVYYIQDDNLFEYKDGELILVYTHKNFQNLVKGYYTVRKLTPIECCRLQGFPDDYFIKNDINIISNTQIYKTLGNSFTVPIVENILQHLLI